MRGGLDEWNGTEPRTRQVPLDSQTDPAIMIAAFVSWVCALRGGRAKGIMHSMIKQVSAQNQGFLFVPGGNSVCPSDNGSEFDKASQTDVIHVREHSSRLENGQVNIELGDSLELCRHWPSPVAIICDGPYGLSSFEGDLHTPGKLAEWYEPHIKLWSEKSTPLTTLWFWNTEIGWATVHHMLAKHGWSYKEPCVWDKGIAHIAGNSNTNVLRRLPTTTELCVHYNKDAAFLIEGRQATMKEWLRYEWGRTGLPFNKTNGACGVKDAATRKYFSKDHLWYFPPVEAFEAISRYANQHGRPQGRPYFSIDGINPISGEEWGRMRAKFHCPMGVTNVWRVPAVRGSERIKEGSMAAHANQKPLVLMELIVRICTDPGDVVWEPFGGLCTAAIACHRLGRRCFSAEVNPSVYEKAISRLAQSAP